MDVENSESTNIIIKVYNPEDGKTNSVVVPHDEISDHCELHTSSGGGEKDLCIWSYKATLSLIKCMESYTSDINDYKLRKPIFDQITGHLNREGHHCSTTQVHNKWKTLVRGFRHANKQKKTTGRKGRFVFYKEMKALLACMPSYNPNHPIHNMDPIRDPICIHNDHDYHDYEVPVDIVKTSNSQKTDNDIQDDALKFLYRCEKHKQSRHKEKMIMEFKKIALLENILNKL